MLHSFKTCNNLFTCLSQFGRFGFYFVSTSPCYFFNLATLAVSLHALTLATAAPYIKQVAGLNYIIHRRAALLVRDWQLERFRFQRRLACTGRRWRCCFCSDGCILLLFFSLRLFSLLLFLRLLVAACAVCIARFQWFCLCRLVVFFTL